MVNNHGQPRLSRFYPNMDVGIQGEITKEVFALVSKRSDNVCNFLEPKGDTEKYAQAWGKDVRLIYRHYATLYFVFAVDKSESELGILDLVQVFVEALDKCFENVCELDLIFHMDKVNFILDEIIMAGMVLETSLKEIIGAVQGTAKLEELTKKTNILSPTVLGRKDGTPTTLASASERIFSWKLSSLPRPWAKD